MGSEAKNSDTEPAHCLGLHGLYIPCTWLRFHPDWSWLGSKLLVTTNSCLPGWVADTSSTFAGIEDRRISPALAVPWHQYQWTCSLGLSDFTNFDHSCFIFYVCSLNEPLDLPHVVAPFSPSNLSFSRLSSTPLFLEVAQGDFSDVDSPFIWTRIRQ